MTVKILLGIIALLIVLSAVLFILWRSAKGKYERKGREVDNLIKLTNELGDENVKLKETIDIMKRNREEADARIEKLHSGDSVANALDVLRKHKD